MSKPDSCVTAQITASGAAALVVSTSPGWLCSVNPLITTTGDLTVFGYDNASAASGTMVYQRKFDSSAVMGTGGSRFDVYVTPVALRNGLTFSITGTAPDGAIIGYAKNP